MRDEGVTTPHQVNLKSVDANIEATGSYTHSKCDEFSRAVSHAILIGMDDDAAATVPELAARLGIPLPTVQSSMEAVRDQLSKLISGLPPTVSKPSQE